MNVVFLFNSDHPTLGSYYGFSIMKAILETHVLQSTKRSMRVSIGDVIIPNGKKPLRINDYRIILKEIYTPTTLNLIHREKLYNSFLTSTIFCWMFQNMDIKTAQSLHEKLNIFDPYLGAMDIKFSNNIHLQVFRNSLIELFRIENGIISIFYGFNEDPENYENELLVQHGFKVKHECIGARRTIFDNFDTLNHFKRIESFEEFFTNMLDLKNEDISDIIYALEELHPKLFDVLAAASRTLERAETDEDLAQAALSGRRFLEKLADYLFPAQEKLWRDRKVGKTQYKNRIWAYITIECEKNNNMSSLETLGKETDRLIDLFNAGLHANPTKEKVEAAFCDLVKWLVAIIKINPASVRKPNLAYEEELENFLMTFLDNK